MKKITLLLFTALLALSCSITKYEKKPYLFSEGVEFKIEYITLAKYSDVGEDLNYQYIAAKGTRIPQILLKIKNNTEENKELNFEEFYIIGKDNTKYEPTIIVPMGIGTTAKGLRLKLKANKKRTVMIQLSLQYQKMKKSLILWLMVTTMKLIWFLKIKP